MSTRLETEKGSSQAAGTATTAPTASVREGDASGAGSARAFAGFPAWTLAILRIGAGLLFMQHGAQKLLGWFGGMGGPGQTAELFSQMGLAGVLELFGGALIVLGFLTRPVAVILLLEMIMAYAIAHAPQGLVPIQNGGELALLYALVFLLFVGFGSGPASLDSRLDRSLSA